MVANNNRRQQQQQQQQHWLTTATPHLSSRLHPHPEVPLHIAADHNASPRRSTLPRQRPKNAFQAAVQLQLYHGHSARRQTQGQRDHSSARENKTPTVTIPLVLRRAPATVNSARERVHVQNRTHRAKISYSTCSRLSTPVL